MKYALSILAFLFGALHALAALLALLKGNRSITHPMMLLGAAMVVAGGVFCLVGNPLDWVAALCGSAIILASAVKNGMDGGKLHLSHHVVRSAMALALALGMVFF